MYGWTHELVALLANYGSILYIVAFLPMVRLLHCTALYCTVCTVQVWLLGYSVRLAMIVTSGFMALGTLLRSPSTITAREAVPCSLCADV